MSSHEHYWRKGQPWRNAKHDRRDYFGKADVAFDQAMMEQVQSLNDKQRDVGVLRSQH